MDCATASLKDHDSNPHPSCPNTVGRVHGFPTPWVHTTQPPNGGVAGVQTRPQKRRGCSQHRGFFNFPDMFISCLCEQALEVVKKFYSFILTGWLVSCFSLIVQRWRRTGGPRSATEGGMIIFPSFQFFYSYYFMANKRYFQCAPFFTWIMQVYGYIFGITFR